MLAGLDGGDPTERVVAFAAWALHSLIGVTCKTEHAVQTTTTKRLCDEGS